MRTRNARLRPGNKIAARPVLPSETPEMILARIDAGIKDADEGRFATDEEVQAEFARWRNA